MPNTIATNLNKRAGIKKEVTWGTAVTVDRFLPLVDESIGGGPEDLLGAGVIAGRLTADTTNTALGNETYKGDLQFELYDHSMAAWFELMLGAVATTGVGPYTHTITPGEPIPSFTLQVGGPSTDGTIRTKTYSGVVVESWELKFEPGKIVTVGLSVTAKTEVLNTAAATVAYPATLIPVVGKNAAVTLYGTSYLVKQLTLKGDNKLTYDERRGLGSSQIGRRQVRQEEAEVTGDASLELEDNFVLYSNMKAGTQGALSVVCTVGSNTTTIAGNIKLTGETPKFTGKGITDQPVKWRHLGANDAAAITVTCVNSDSTP